MDGVIVGCDAAQEWMLPWWWACYSAHNKAPVAFADFGMSAKGRDWCSSKVKLDNALILQITNKFPKTWFHKPFALLESPFDRSIWIDVDCEVRGSINEIFEFCDLGFTVSEDPHAVGCSNQYFNPPLATGVIGISGKPELLHRWTQSLTNHSAKYRGDQECFNDILKEDDPIVIMPAKFQRLRLDNCEFNDTVIKHWTGPAGKDIIRSKISGPKCLMAINQREHILKALPSDGKMLEWGSGGSTIWFLENMQPGQHLTSIEENEHWFNKVQEKIEASGFTNHKYLLVRSQFNELRKNAHPSEENPVGLDDYIHPPIDLGEFDVILVDGVARGACLASVYGKTNAKIFIHDSNRGWYDWAIRLYSSHRVIKADQGDYPPDLTEIASNGIMV